MSLPEYGKVICYIVRDDCVLAFAHRGNPAAGIQVPAGTIELGESPEEAALREATEETGLDGIALVAKLGESEYRFDHPPRLEIHRRYFFQMRVAIAAEHWSHFAEGHIWFDFSWLPLSQQDTLAADQGAMLHLVRL